MPSTASIVRDSISEAGVRITTMAVTYPRIVHAELMTHRVFSRNASSSRAIPTERIISDVEANPASPARWGVNQRGMQDGGQMTMFGRKRAAEVWNAACNSALTHAAEMMAGPEKPHKQVVNRILEPYSHITVLITSTYWKNWFWLRDHEDADPTIRVLAEYMQDAYARSTPSVIPKGGWHLPYITAVCSDLALSSVIRNATGDFFIDDFEDYCERNTLKLLCQQSAARCARVSYNLHDGTEPTIESDLGLFYRLCNEGGPMHASPFEHQASPDWKIVQGAATRWAHPLEHGNFVGWRQYRKQMVGEAQMEHPNTVDDLYQALRANEIENERLRDLHETAP